MNFVSERPYRSVYTLKYYRKIGTTSEIVLIYSHRVLLSVLNEDSFGESLVIVVQYV